MAPAGGREPAIGKPIRIINLFKTWERWSVALQGGCWKDRVYPFGNGDERDVQGRLFRSPVGRLARCMDLITAEEVIRRIERSSQGGALRGLTSREIVGSRQAIERMVENPFVDGDEGKAMRGR